MGILDALNNLTPDQGQALLSFGSGLLNAGGYSARPVSFGQAFSSGVQNLTATQQRLLDQQKEQEQLAMLRQQVAQATRKNGLINDFLAGALGGQGSASPQSAGASQSGMSMGGGMPSMTGGSMASPGGFGGVPSAAVAADLAFNNGGKIGEWINDRSKPTDFTKQLIQAGIDPESAIGKQIMQNKLGKDTYIAPLNTRPGSIIRDPNDPTKILSFNPHIPDGGMPQFDANGNVTGIVPLPGAAGVAAAMTRATAGAKNSVEPMTAYDENGNPVFTNKTTAAGGGFPSIPPAVQAQRNQGQLEILQAERQRATDPADIAALDREIARVSGTTSPQGAFGRLAPALAPGMAESRTALATTGAKRYNDMISLAADSPTRVNVYDNILNLSKEGVQTGPGEAWKNKVKGYAANTPLLNSISGIKNWQNDVTGFQELNKFMYQNAQRNWQAAGGTGTDSQLEAFSKANPNDAMFPQALQKMAEWGKAGELAVQGKANAMQNWKDTQGGNVTNQDQFERMWRNNFDPVLFQLKTMSPQDAAAYVANLKKNNPSAYSSLMMKAQAMKNIGGL